MLSTSPEIAGTPQAYAGWPQQNVYPTVQPSISGYNQPSNGYMTPSFYTVSQPRRLSLRVFAVHVEMKIWKMAETHTHTHTHTHTNTLIRTHTHTTHTIWYHINIHFVFVLRVQQPSARAHACSNSIQHAAPSYADCPPNTIQWGLCCRTHSCLCLHAVVCCIEYRDPNDMC
jgi:hypothetical protein